MLWLELEFLSSKRGAKLWTGLLIYSRVGSNDMQTLAEIFLCVTNSSIAHRNVKLKITNKL